MPLRILLLLFPLALSFAQDARVVLLGTSTPNPEPERSGPAVAIISGQRVYVVDFGPGVVRRAKAAGIEIKQLTRGLVTHLHSDSTSIPTIPPASQTSSSHRQ